MIKHIIGKIYEFFMKAVAKQKHRKAKAFITWHKESIFITLTSGNVLFFCALSIGCNNETLLAENCDFLEFKNFRIFTGLSSLYV